MTVFPFLLLATSMIFKTGSPEPTSTYGIVAPMDAAAYESFTAQAVKMPNVVPIRQKPPLLSKDALYGFNFVVDGFNRGWIIDKDPDGRFLLYLDWYGNGNLSSTKPNVFALEEGIQSLRVEIKSNDGRRRLVRFEIDSMVIEGSKRAIVKCFDMTIRSGNAIIDGKRIPFRIHGSAGYYDDPHQTIEFDRKESGEWEKYEISEKFVNIAGNSYEFTVDKYGDELKLTRIAERHPERVSLMVGSQAPGFQAKSLDGRLIKSPNFLGKWLLIEFWATSCAPCRAEAPELVEYYKDNGAKLSIIGISSDDKRETLNRFLTQCKIEWPQINENSEGELHRLFRASAMPTYFLINPDGKIIDKWEGAGDTVDRIRRHIK